jgi:hypothetical protein
VTKQCLCRSSWTKAIQARAQREPRGLPRQKPSRPTELEIFLYIRGNKQTLGKFLWNRGASPTQYNAFDRIHLDLLKIPKCVSCDLSSKEATLVSIHA